METRFSITLMLEFVGLERRVGDRVNPSEQIAFKVFHHWKARARQDVFWNGVD